MFYGRDKFKFVLVGAGSSVFTMRLAGDILAEEAIRGGEIALVDIAEGALRQARVGSEMLIRRAGKPFFGDRAPKLQGRAARGRLRVPRVRHRGLRRLEEGHRDLDALRGQPVGGRTPSGLAR